MKKHHQLFGFVIAVIAVSAPFAHSQEPLDELQEAQIKALRTGDITGLNQLLALSTSPTDRVRLTVSWTTLAAKQLAGAKANVSYESALLTSKFIFNGANRF